MEFRVKDLLRPRKDIVNEAGIEEGFIVLDYGCGPCSYIAPVAELVASQVRYMLWTSIRLLLRRSSAR